MHTVISRDKRPVLAAEGVIRSDAEATNSAANRKLFKSRVPIYPKEAAGTYRSIKWAMMAFTLSIYYLVPWLRWNRGAGAPHQAVLVDLAHERLYFFFIEIWPQEVYYITGLLILAAVSLFLINALFGRLWCGYACPADGLDRSLHLGRNQDRGRSQRPHPAGRRALDLRQDLPSAWPSMPSGW